MSSFSLMLAGGRPFSVYSAGSGEPMSNLRKPGITSHAGGDLLQDITKSRRARRVVRAGPIRERAESTAPSLPEGRPQADGPMGPMSTGRQIDLQEDLKSLVRHRGWENE